MTEAIIIKKQCLLQRAAAVGRYVTFFPDNESPSYPHPEVVLRDHQWQDMGSPEEITVTIEPGDKLNG